MSQVLLRQYTMELYTNDVLDETEIISEKAAKGLAAEALGRLLPEDQVPGELFGLNATLGQGQAVEITNEKAGTKLVLKPYVEKH